MKRPPDDLAGMTDAQLRQVMRRDKPRAQSALKVWLARRGLTTDTASALIYTVLSAGIHDAAKKAGGPLDPEIRAAELMPLTGNVIL